MELITTSKAAKSNYYNLLVKNRPNGQKLTLMTYTSSAFLGPDTTPKAIQKLILTTCLIALFSALTEPVFTQIFGIPGLQTWLSLSWIGIHHYFIWQPLSYLFVQSNGAMGITLSFLIGLAFDMYILWIMGSAILEAVGTKPFLRLYFLSGIGAGLLALVAMYITKRYGIVAGPLSSILAIMTVWTMLNPEANLLIFFLFLLKAKWLLAGILGAILLVNVSQGDGVSLVLYLSGALLGYLYALMAWDLKSPFAWTHRFDRFLASCAEKMRTGTAKAQEIGRKTKILDIQTGKPIEDDESFVDAMLTKIAKKGEKSLTWRERHRLNSISERKRDQKKR